MSLIGLSIPGDAAKKLLGFLKQKLPSSCLTDLLCSHTYSKFYLRRGRSLDEGEELLGEDLRAGGKVELSDTFVNFYDINLYSY